MEKTIKARLLITPTKVYTLLMTDKEVDKMRKEHPYRTIL